MDFMRKVDKSQYEDNAMPEYPARTLGTHVVLRGMQIGSVCGLLMTPVLRVLTKMPMQRAFLLVGPVAPFIGGTVMFSVLLGKDLDSAGVDERAYRLSKNTFQLDMDKLSVMSGLLGLSIGTLANFGFRASLSLSGVGLSSGLVFFFGKKAMNKMKYSQIAKQKGSD